MLRLLLIAAALSTLSLPAAELIVLTNGFTMRAERVEALGSALRLYTSEGTVEVSAAQIAERESEPVPPADAPPPAVAVEAALPSPPPAAPQPQQLLDQAAVKVGLPAAFLHSVAKVESAFKPRAVSPKGAIGVMQLMPGTAKILGVDPHDPAQNIEGGARLLRELLLKYQNHPDQVRRALAAYNAGAGAVQRYNGTPPYAETQNYVNRVLGEYNRLRTASR